MSQITPEYPLKLTIDYPDRNLNRLTSFFRIFAAIPILIIAILLLGAAIGDNGAKESGWNLQYAAGIIFLPVVLMTIWPSLSVLTSCWHGLMLSSGAWRLTRTVNLLNPSLWDMLPLTSRIISLS